MKQVERDQHRAATHGKGLLARRAGLVVRGEGLRFFRFFRLPSRGKAVLLLASLAGLLPHPQAALASYDILQARWSHCLSADPISHTSGDLNHDDYPEILVALSDQRIIAFNHKGDQLWSKRGPSGVSLIRCGDVDGKPGDELVIVGRYSLEVWDGNGRSTTRIHLKWKPDEYADLKLSDWDGDGFKDIICLLSGRVVIVRARDLVGRAPSPQILAVDFRPKAFEVYDADRDGHPELFVVDEGQVAMLKQDGSVGWRHPFDRGEFLLFSPFSQVLEVGDPDRDGAQELFIGLGLTGREEGAGRVVCLHLENGREEWAQEVPGPVSSLMLSGSLLCVGGCRGLDQPKLDRLVRAAWSHGLMADLGLDDGFLLKLTSQAEVAYKTPTISLPYFLTPISDSTLVASLYEIGACVFTAKPGGAVGLHYQGVSVQGLEPCDLNRDGALDIVAIAPIWDSAQGRFRLDAAFNMIPELQSRADQRRAGAREALRRGDLSRATRELEWAEYIYGRLGEGQKRRLAHEEIQAIERKERVETSFRRTIGYMLLSLGLLLFLLVFVPPFRELLKRGIAGIKAKAVQMRLMPGSPLEMSRIRELETGFIHEAKKKPLLLMLALKKLEEEEEPEKSREILENQGRALAEACGWYRGELSQLGFGKIEAEIATLNRLIRSIPKHAPPGRDLLTSIGSALETCRQDILENLPAAIQSLRQEMITEATRKAVERIVEEKEGVTRALGIKVVARINVPPPRTRVLSERFEQWTLVLSNIIRNGVEAVESAVERMHIEETRRIVSVTVERGQSGSTLIQVEDKGIGMSVEVRDRIFDRGFTAEKKTGSGLGLTEEALRFLKERGKVTIESHPGLGTRFIIEVGNP